MYTSVVLVALTGWSASAAEAPSKVSWQSDYATARQLSSRANKPMAVFVGSGPEGWKGLSKDRKLSAKATETLAKSYVCVTVDTSTPAGRELGNSLSMNGGSGLVLSTFGGENQAFWHEGEMTDADLEARLTRYAQSDRTVARTETLGTTDVRYSYNPTGIATTGGMLSGVPGSVPTMSAPFYSGAYAPSYAPAYAPQYHGGFGGFGGGYSGGFGGGCPGGRCR